VLTKLFQLREEIKGNHAKKLYRTRIQTATQKTYKIMFEIENNDDHNGRIVLNPEQNSNNILACTF
jgi:hypothetical protein